MEFLILYLPGSVNGLIHAHTSLRASRLVGARGLGFCWGEGKETKTQTSSPRRCSQAVHTLARKLTVDRNYKYFFRLW